MPDEIDPPNSRLFVVCGKFIEVDALQEAFHSFGNLEGIKIIKDKGVAYVKYDKASSAALAMESLNGAVLNNGRGPKLKVLLAESPTSPMRASPPTPQPSRDFSMANFSEHEITSDPDNIPPRSRLFIVVPKNADAQQIQEDMNQFPDLEYCKIDLIPTKGVIFCKFSKASSALKTLEDIDSRGLILAGYKVKCMVAEPKTKRRPESAPQDMRMPASSNHRGGNSGRESLSSHFGHSTIDGNMLKISGGLPLGMAEYALSSGLSATNLSFPLAQVGLGFVGGMPITPGLQILPHGMPITPMSLGNNSSMPQPQPHLSRQRLFVVVHKSVNEDSIARLFRRFPGCEYVDVKKDRDTGRAKGFCFINYSTPEAARAAIEQINGIEFPPQTGHRIKVMYAEPLTAGGPSSSAGHSNANHSSEQEARVDHGQPQQQEQGAAQFNRGEAQAGRS